MNHKTIDQRVEKLNKVTAPQGVVYFWTGDPKGYCMLYEKTKPGEASMVFNAPAKKFVELVDEELDNFPQRGLQGQRVRLKPGTTISLDDHEHRDKLRALSEGVVLRDNAITLDVNFSGVVLCGITRDNFQVQEWKDLDLQREDSVGKVAIIDV